MCLHLMKSLSVIFNKWFTELMPSKGSQNEHHSNAMSLLHLLKHFATHSHLTNDSPLRKRPYRLKLRPTLGSCRPPPRHCSCFCCPSRQRHRRPRRASPGAVGLSARARRTASCESPTWHPGSALPSRASQSQPPRRSAFSPSSPCQDACR